MLEGVVTNIVAFGCFVDVGVHQDGLVHVSQLADRFVADPNQVVKVGQKVRVTVMGVDLARNRIALSMKSKPDAAAPRAAVPASRDGRDDRRAGGAPRPTGSREPQRRAQRPPAFTPAPGAVAPNGMRFK